MGSDRMIDPQKLELIQEGVDPKCAHEGLLDVGRGTAALFWQCASCGAKFSQRLDGVAANDPFLQD